MTAHLCEQVSHQDDIHMSNSPGSSMLETISMWYVRQLSIITDPSLSLSQDGNISIALAG
jgi:hypothetical protein